jgi:DDRGK domain-containing protein 1
MFFLTPEDVVNRVQALIQMGRLTGVLDDRGKFIYISEAEMEAVAKFIKQRGRVGISELSQRSNDLIDLKPKLDVNPRAAA